MLISAPFCVWASKRSQIQVKRGCKRAWFGAGREATESRDGISVVGLKVLTRAGDGQGVEQCEEFAVKPLHERVGVVALLLRPAIEHALGRAEGRFQAGNAERLLEACVIASGQKEQLVPQVAQIVIHRRCREQQHLRLHPAPHDVLHQTLVARTGDAVAGLILATTGVVAKVVRLINQQ